MLGIVKNLAISVPLSISLIDSVLYRFSSSYILYKYRTKGFGCCNTLFSSMHQHLPPSLSSVSKTLHLCRVIACCVVKCFSMLEVFPPFDVIKALHVLQLAVVLSFLVKYNQTLECFCLNTMLETF